MDMFTDWQTVLSLAVVAMAAAVLLRQAVLFVTRPQTRGCGTCPSNKASSRAKQLPLVQLSSPLSRPHQDILGGTCAGSRIARGDERYQSANQAD
jgi:hypothetical protein